MRLEAIWVHILLEHWLLTPSPLMGKAGMGVITACYAASIHLVYLYRGFESDV